MDNRSNADSRRETPIRVSPNGRGSLCLLFRQGKERVAGVRRNGLLKGRGGFQYLGSLMRLECFSEQVVVKENWVDYYF